MASNIFNEILNTISEHELAESDIAFRVAQRIDFLMHKTNTSKSDLARGLDKDPAQISRWMSGEHNFSIKTLAQLELFFKDPILISPTAAEDIAEPHQDELRAAAREALAHNFRQALGRAHDIGGIHRLVG